MQKKSDLVSPADDQARNLAADLLNQNHAALSYTDAETGTPGISRIALGRSPDGTPMTLISALAPHFAALRQSPPCALLVGEPGAKGDPLTHPRLMIRASAEFLAPAEPRRAALRDHWLAGHPKAKLYIDFADFALVLLHPQGALLNAGFGKAFHLATADLLPR